MSKNTSLKIKNKTLFIFENKQERNNLLADTTTSTITLTGTGMEFNAIKAKK